MRRPRRSYPQHSLPLLAATGCSQPISMATTNLSRQQRWILKHLRNGARILLDMDQRRALIYSFRKGMEELAQITLRTLSSLVRAGVLIAVAREGRLVHYDYATP